jgi:hypothetical protein
VVPAETLEKLRGLDILFLDALRYTPHPTSPLLKLLATSIVTSTVVWHRQYQQTTASMFDQLINSRRTI